MKDDSGDPRKLVNQTKPEKLTEADLAAIQEAVSRLEHSSEDIRRLFQKVNQDHKP